VNGEGATIAEIRGEGGQTIYPPSTNGDEGLVWHQHSEPGEVLYDDLYKRVARIAAAALLARYWKDGDRHDSTLPLAGFLLRRRGMTEDAVADFLDDMATAVGADHHKVQADVAAPPRGSGGMSLRPDGKSFSITSPKRSFGPPSTNGSRSTRKSMR
jgi:hypothetical protein